MPCEFVRVAEQETNDLDKAIRLCRERGWGDLVVVGATGLREDHAIGNVYRALAAEVRGGGGSTSASDLDLEESGRA